MRPPSARSACLLVAVWALLVQLPGLSGEFIWDDTALLRDSDLYTSVDRLGEALTHALGKETFYWRPLATTSFLLESALHGGAVWGYRLTSALLHAATAVLVLVVLRRLLDAGRDGAASLGSWCALGGALAFAAHPVTAEAVTWPSGRFDGLAGLLVVATLACVPRPADVAGADGPTGGGPGAGRLVALGALSALALLAKELALTLPVLVLVWGLALSVPARGWLAGVRGSWRSAAASTAGVLAVLVARADVLGYVLRTRDASVAAAGETVDHAALVARTVGTYALLLLQPFGTVGPLHHAPTGNVADGLTAFGWIVGVAALGLTGWCLWRRLRVGFVLLAFLVSVAPVSQVVPLDLSGGLHAADRFLYLPAVFAIGAAVLGLRTWLSEERSERAPRAEPEDAPADTDDSAVGATRPARPVRLVAGLTVVLLLGYGAFRALVVLPGWRSEAAFWEWGHAMAPSSDVGAANLFQVYWRQGRTDDAEALARQLVDAYPLGGYQTFLARILEVRDDVPGALRVLDAAITRVPDRAELHTARGRLRLLLGQNAAAFDDFLRAVDLLEKDGEPRFLSVLPQALAGASVAGVAVPGGPSRSAPFLARAESLAEPRDHAAWMLITWANLAAGNDEGALRAIGHVHPADLALRDALRLIRIAAVTFPDGCTMAELEARARSLGATEIDVLLARADGLARHDDAGRAAATYREVLALDPASWPAALALWDLAFVGRTKDDVVQLARRLTEVRPASPEAWDALGYTLFEHGKDTAGAEAAFRTALEHAPTAAAPRFHLGMLLRGTERADEGRAEIEQARTHAARSGDIDLLRSIDAALQ